jgi:hypothetical protein
MSTIIRATIYIHSTVHRTSFDTAFHPLYDIVRFLLDYGHEIISTDMKEVHVDIAAKNHRTSLRLPPGSDYLLRRVKDVPYMQNGLYNFYAYCENRKEAVQHAQCAPLALRLPPE